MNLWAFAPTFMRRICLVANGKTTRHQKHSYIKTVDIADLAAVKTFLGLDNNAVGKAHA